jgi:hypothetical protein
MVLTLNLITYWIMPNVASLTVTTFLFPIRYCTMCRYCMTYNRMLLLCSIWIVTIFNRTNKFFSAVLNTKLSMASTDFPLKMFMVLRSSISTKHMLAYCMSCVYSTNAFCIVMLYISAGLLLCFRHNGHLACFVDRRGLLVPL